MKHIICEKTARSFRFIIYMLLPLVGGGWMGVSCSDWDDHYDEADISSSDVEVYDGTITDYLRSQSDLSAITQLLQQGGVFDSTTPDKQYTFIVCDNQTLQGSTESSHPLFARYCVSDAAVTPSELVDGFGINNRAGKTIWVYADGNGVRIDNFAIRRTVKAQNGYVYVIDGVLPVRLSVYEYLQTRDLTASLKKGTWCAARNAELEIPGAIKQ